jgi:hypothetical protein
MFIRPSFYAVMQEEKVGDPCYSGVGHGECKAPSSVRKSLLSSCFLVLDLLS